MKEGERAFDKKLQAFRAKRNSRLILAIDLVGHVGLLRSKQLIPEVIDYLVGVKFGYPTILFNEEGLKQIIREYSGETCFIADAKLADVSHVNVQIARALFSIGFDAIIAHGFIGYSGGLDNVATLAREEGKGLMVLVSMSHDAARNIMDPMIDAILTESLKTWPSGLVAPATRPEVIKGVRSRVGPDMKIFSPGVGAQGAPFGSALANGADYEIVGRAIYEDVDPVSRARLIVEIQRKVTSNVS